jgi:hypothetical protein
MVMVVHQTVGVGDPMKTIVDLGQAVQKQLAIEVVFENRLALVTLEVT